MALLEKDTILTEISSLQKQAQDAYATLHKLEGALQFAHHILSLLDAPDSAPEADTKLT